MPASLRNIQKRTGKTIDQLFTIIRESALQKHGLIRDMLKRDLGMGHGDANTLVHRYLSAQAQQPVGRTGSVDQATDEIYTGAKAGLRPIHDKFMQAIGNLGPFEICPKKNYLSLRRKKQFASIGPATRTRVEVGLNMKGVKASSRLVELPPGKMCQSKVDRTDPAVHQSVRGAGTVFCTHCTVGTTGPRSRWRGCTGEQRGTDVPSVSVRLRKKPNESMVQGPWWPGLKARLTLFQHRFQLCQPSVQLLDVNMGQFGACPRFCPICLEPPSQSTRSKPLLTISAEIHSLPKKADSYQPGDIWSREATGSGSPVVRTSRSHPSRTSSSANSI